MLKIIIFLLTFLSALSLNASSYVDSVKNNVNYDLSFYAGLNVAEPLPVLGFKVGFEFLFFRASFDVGKTFISHPLCLEGVTTVSPSIGFFYGKQEKFYAAVGFQNFGIVNTLVEPDKFRSDHIYGLVRAGFQHFFRERLFFSIEATHLFHDNKSGFEHFPSTNLCFGLGFTF